jgi:hypothetical protein
MFKKTVIADVYVNGRETKNNGQDDNNHYSIGETIPVHLIRFS